MAESKSIHTEVITNYLKGLTMDMWIAYAIIIVGIIAVILSFFI